MLKLLNKQYLIASNKHNFVKGILENTLLISGKKKSEIIQLLKEKGFKTYEEIKLTMIGMEIDEETSS